MITASLVVSCLILFLIAIRQWLPSSLRIWHIRVAGAVILLLLGEIKPGSAFRAIDWNVIADLLGVFVIAATLYDSGISHAIGARIAAMHHPGLVPLVLIVIAALCSAELTNDAAADSCGVGLWRPLHLFHPTRSFAAPTEEQLKHTFATPRIS